MPDVFWPVPSPQPSRKNVGGVTFHKTKPPDAVLFAASTEEVSDALRICHSDRCPVIAFGTGTSTEGQISAEHDGLMIDLSRMDEILRISAADMDCTVQAVSRAKLSIRA
jgi:D-lactate dehydrogenase (cytochrome)